MRLSEYYQQVEFDGRRGRPGMRRTPSALRRPVRWQGTERREPVRRSDERTAERQR